MTQLPPPNRATGDPRTWHEKTAADGGKRSDIPAGLWMRCPSCAAMIYRKNVEQNKHVCPECQHHFRIGAEERATQLCDQDSFDPL